VGDYLPVKALLVQLTISWDETLPTDGNLLYRKRVNGIALSPKKILMRMERSA
jgi:hypothetical protein